MVLWNEQRKLILQDAFSKFLLPSLEKEARVLLTWAKKWLLMECRKQLWNRVSVAPYQRNEHDAGLDEETAPRMMACCWGPGNPATTFVMLDSSGELLDWMYAGSLSLYSKNVDLQRKKDETQCLLKSMTDHQPHFIVLGAANLIPSSVVFPGLSRLYKL
ncbi:transcription elongation factor SPT6 homolog [Fagus crenata]